MSTSSSTALFKGTPTISVKDNRGLAIRTIQYNRTAVTDKLDCLITRSTYNATGQLASSSDPRLFKQGINNISKINNLLGQPLRVDSVDAGWHIALADIEGMPHKEWDELGTARYYDYDESFHRPIAVHELHTDIKDETKQVTERFVYGDSTQTNDNLNLQLIRHYDHAGLSEITSINLTGQPLTQNRQLLLSKSGESDWQESDETAWKDKLNSTVYPTQWTYNALGTMLSQLDAKGNRQRSEYDVSGVLSASYLLLVNQPESSEKTLVSDIKYNANGQKIHERAGNKVVTSYTYDERDWRLMQVLTERPVKEGRNTQLQNLNYTYDPVGNIVSIKDATEATRFYKNQRVVPEQTYTYDALNQLITASGRENDAHPQQNSTLPPLHDASNYINYSRTYTYDKAGNLLTIGHNGANQYTLNMVVSNNSNRTVQQISDNPISADKVDELFDALGNLKQLEHSKALTWGRYNQLEKVALTNKQHEVYQYSAQGTRIRKLLSDDDNESEVIYLPGLELRTKRGSVSEILHVVTLMNTGRSQVRLLHWQEDCLPSDIPNNQLRYSMDNHLGSSNLELNCNADILTMEEYYPFGGTALWSAKNQTEAKYKTIRYSGKERDATGLYYYGYRYYMPWMGRWLNPDPAGTVDGLNLYQMVRNNPVNLKDPTGMLAHTLVSKPIKKLDSYLTKKTTKYLQDKGKSVETIRKWNNARRTVMLGVGIGIAVGSFAAGVGASIGVAVGVGAAGILAGAAIGAFANKISDTAAGHMANNVNGKSVTIQTLAGAAVATLSAATHGASKGGGLLASAGGAASGALMGALDQTERGMAGANAGGSAVGTADTLSGGKARLPVQFGAMTGGIMGGWVLGKTKGSASVGEYAGIGACLGGRMGRYIDRITSLSGLVGEVMRQYSTTGAMAAWGIKKLMGDSAGHGEWGGALAGGVAAGTFRAVDLNTDGEATRTTTALNTAWTTVNWDRFTTAFGNYFNSNHTESMA